MPVDTIMGLPLPAVWASSGRLVISPEGTLKTAMSKPSSRSALASSKKLDMKIILRSSQ